MTPQEFKAWFDGYTENISKQPTQKQWKRIQERVGEIDGTPITEKVFVDRYWPYVPYYPNYDKWPGTAAPHLPWITWTSGTANNSQTMTTANTDGPLTSTYVNMTDYNSCSAMKALGQAEAHDV